MLKFFGKYIAYTLNFMCVIELYIRNWFIIENNNNNKIEHSKDTLIFLYQKYFGNCYVDQAMLYGITEALFMVIGVPSILVFWFCFLDVSSSIILSVYELSFNLVILCIGFSI